MNFAESSFVLSVQDVDQSEGEGVSSNILKIASRKVVPFVSLSECYSYHARALTTRLSVYVLGVGDVGGAWCHKNSAVP